MPAMTLTWPAEALWSAIEPFWPGFSVEVLPQVDSTNTTLMERARDGHMHPVLLVAEQQKAGRGRMGKQWRSGAPGDALTFSLGLPMPEGDLSGLSLVVGCSVAHSLDPQHRHELRLKWPNDLWYRQRKLGGILVEVCMLGSQRYVVIGTGINIVPQPGLPAADPAAPVPQPPAWVQEFSPRATAPDVLAQVAAPLAQAMQQFAASGFAPWAGRFQVRDGLAGQAVWLTDGSSGTARGVNPQGALLVQTGHGMRAILSDEVSVRPLPGAPASPYF